MPPKSPLFETVLVYARNKEIRCYIYLGLRHHYEYVLPPSCYRDKQYSVFRLYKNYAILRPPKSHVLRRSSRRRPSTASTPFPPLESEDLYGIGGLRKEEASLTVETSNLGLFFRSLLPNFSVEQLSAEERAQAGEGG